MLRATYIQPKLPFRPVGDVPPLSLTRRLSPDQETANCLLLRCGDIRDVLFTVYCNTKDPLKLKELHFLCSDDEDAIIARNVLFLSQLSDETFNIDEEVCWSIYFDVCIDSRCFDLICEQACRLVSLSENISDWRLSKYGRLFTFADEKSLHNVRRCWKYYYSLSQLSLKKRSVIFDDFMTDFKIIYEETTTDKISVNQLTMFGPTFIHGTGLIKKSFNPFWTAAIARRKNSKTASKYFVNPLFAFSTVARDECAIEGKTNPNLGFHCASALADIKPGGDEYCGSYSDSMTNEQKLSRALKTAKIQFKTWCSAFRAEVFSKSTKISICHHAGDPVRFCRALERYINPPSTEIYEPSSAPWNPPIIFNEDSKIKSRGRFNVIDATGLADIVPPLVVLISTIPLLQNSVEATLFTSKFVSHDASVKPQNALKSQWFCDPMVMFTLFGLAPSEYITSVYHHARPLEIVSPLLADHDILDEVKTLWRFSWKRVLLADPLAQDLDNIPQPVWDDDTLVTVLHEIHDAMFSADNPKTVRDSVVGEVETVKSSGCTRASFAAFLQYLTRHIKANWTFVLSKLCSLVTDLALNIFKNVSLTIHRSDFLLQLRLYNVFAEPALTTISQDIRSRIPASWYSVLGDGKLPDTMPFILRIPRGKLETLDDYVYAFRGEPHEVVLQINVSHGEEYSLVSLFSAFSSFEMTFGTLLNTNDLKGRVIRVDEEGWEGEGDLFAFIHLPLNDLFKTMAGKIRTTLGLTAALREPAAQFLRPARPDLLVFETDISNSANFWPVANTKALPLLNVVESNSAPFNRNGRLFTDPKIFMSPKGALQVLFRVDLQDPADIKPDAEMDAIPMSLCTSLIKCGGWEEWVVSPFSIDRSTLKIKVSRKSGWIEFRADMEIVNRQPRLNFHGLQSDGKSASWSLPRLNMDALPTLSLSTSNNLAWIQANIKSMISESENNLWITNSTADPLVMLKGSIFTVIRTAAGFSHNDARIRTTPASVVLMGLGDSTNASAVLFITGIKLNVTADSVVVDAHILPLRDETIKILSSELDEIAVGASMVICESEEYMYWKYYLRTSIEQSRSWSHTEGCNAYMRPQIGQQPEAICRCGEGHVSAEFRATKRWEKFIPYVTRCPLMPVFPAPYKEVAVPGDSILGLFEDLFVGLSNRDNTLRCLKCEANEGPRRFKKCASCGIAWYCSKECQRNDWKRHKKECGKQST